MRIRQVILRINIGGQSFPLDVSHYPYDFTHRTIDYVVTHIHLYVLADRVLMGKILVRKGMIDDHHRRALASVLLLEGPAGEKRNTHRLKEAGHHHADCFARMICLGNRPPSNAERDAGIDARP